MTINFSNKVQIISDFSVTLFKIICILVNINVEKYYFLQKVQGVADSYFEIVSSVKRQLLWHPK